MKSNVSLGATEDPTAPWNKKLKCIEVNISQCLSTTTTTEVPADFEYDSEILKDCVREQILLPSDLKDLRGWNVDEFWVGV